MNGAFWDHPTLSTFDATVDEAFEALRDNSVINRVMYGCSAAGDHSAVWIAMCLIDAARRRSLRFGVISLAMLGLESGIVNGPMKMLTRRQRPLPDPDSAHKVRAPKTSSFPSGHASAGILAAFMLSTDRRHSLPYFGFGLLVGISRVHVRIHHPSDVLGGMLVGTGFGLMARRLLRDCS